MSRPFSGFGPSGQEVKDVAACYEKAGFNRITLALVADARHEVLNEHNHEKTYHTILDWLEQQQPVPDDSKTS